MYQLIIADDDHIEREGIKFLIQHFGFPLETTEAKNGREALELLQKHQCDLMITDIKMPFLDGLQLVKESRAIHPDLIVIILSGHGEFEYAKKAISLQVIQYLLKPIEEEEFKDVLHNAIHQLDNRTKPQEPVRLTHNISISESEPHSHGRAVEEVIHIIKSEYGSDLSLEYLASRVHLTPSYFSHMFKKTTGVSLVKYVNKYRMERAKEYLDQSNFKIVDVYRMVGFSDPSYFSMTFKNLYGVTPSQYREMTGPSK